MKFACAFCSAPTVSTSVADFARADLELRTAPNPALGFFTVEIPADRFGELDRPAVRLVDLTGRTVRTQPLRAATQRVDLTGVPGGLYFYRLLENGVPVSGGRRLVVR